MIVSMTEDSRDNLWIGTWPTGMARFNKATGKSKRYYEKKGGLIDNTANAIVPDDDGYLWISTKNGICRLTRHRSLSGLLLRRRWTTEQ